MEALSADRVNAWRLGRQRLLQRGGLLDAVRTLGGIQAQVMSSAELSIQARAEHLGPDQVAAALWTDRALVKTWAMRGTLHLLAREDLPLYVAARQALPSPRPPSWFSYHKVTPDELEAIMDGVATTLGATPLTRERLAEAIAARSGRPNVREVLLSGWGALLKPSAFRGELCFGPNEGQNVTFVNPAAWLGPWEPLDPSAALAEVARRYLRAYGPASSEEFARWWGIQPAPAKRIFRGLGEELAPVAVDGWPAWALREDMPELRASGLDGPVARLLPAFDLYTIALYRQPFVLAEAFHKQVSRPQGWISPAVLVDGRIAGVWGHEVKRGRLAIAVEPFERGGPLDDAAIRAGIAAEAERLADFLGAAPEITYKD